VVAYANIFQPLIDIFEAVLKFFHNTIGVPWGWSIVLLTVAIRAALIPLTLKQFHSMQELQRHQPELKAIQQRYKDDKQRQQQELMKFYKENKINPLASCLPLAAQLPVFISLFYMLRQDLRKNICPDVQTLAHTVHHVAANQTVSCTAYGSAALHGKDPGFLFIHDLTRTATGATLIVLILLYVGTQLGSTLMMQSPTMDKTQRQMMMFLPLVFVIFIINFPAGLLVYWITTNAWTIIQQYIVRQRIGHMAPAPAAAGSGAAIASGRAGVARGGGALSESAEADGQARPAGLGSLLRGLTKGEEEEPAKSKAATRTAAPPPPPRKKKKRSGRRR
jgi:YidC/Oxa1 family membrane protein insertase